MKHLWTVRRDLKIGDEILSLKNDPLLSIDISLGDNDEPIALNLGETDQENRCVSINIKDGTLSLKANIDMELLKFRYSSDLYQEENININDIDEEVIPKKRNLFFDNNTPDLLSIYRQYKNDKIFINYDYQREYIWDITKASRLIESLLLKIPIPSIYCAETEQGGRYEIIDGQQRITSIINFLDNDFTLKNLEIIPVLNGLTYKEMKKNHPDATSLIEESYIPFIRITKESDSDVKFDVFMRINQGSTDLNEQELRNCLYRGTLSRFLKDMRSAPTVQTIMNTSGQGHLRYQDMELLLRMLAMYDAVDFTTFQLFSSSKDNKLDYYRYRGNMKSHLNAYMLNNLKSSDRDIEKKIISLDTMLEIVYKIFGERSFRRSDLNTRTLNSAIVDIISISFLFYIDKGDENLLLQKADQIKEKFTELHNNDEFMLAITAGTSGVKNINIRLKLWFAELNSIMRG